MSRASNEAATGRPTVEQEMANFKGFSTSNGDTITPETPEDLNPVSGKNQTADEAKAASAKAATGKEGKAAPAVTAKDSKLTDAESDKVITELDAKLGREATQPEVDKALSDALNTKNGSGKTNAERKSAARYRRMEGERNAALARTTDLERRLAALEAGKGDLTDDKGKSKAATADEAPDPKKFEYGELDTGYIRALARWEAKQEIAEQTDNQKKTALTAQQQADKAKFDAAKAEFEDKGSELYDDFEEVVMQGARDKAWPLSDTLGAVLITSEFGAKIAYELASDPKEAKRIFAMAPMAQVKWLGRQEAKLESAGSGANENEEGTEGESEDKPKPGVKTVPKVSKAPTPITRTRGQGSASVTSGDTADFAAFEAAAMGRKT